MSIQIWDLCSVCVCVYIYIYIIVWMPNEVKRVWKLMSKNVICRSLMECPDNYYFSYSYRPKWPISINCRNIWPNSTVCEIISHLPLFGVLELGELEYPFFFVHRGTWRWHLKFLKTNWYPSSWSSSTIQACLPTSNT